jgi:acetyl-CoA carboxylase carboxyltransferase component
VSPRARPEERPNGKALSSGAVVGLLGYLPSSLCGSLPRVSAVDSPAGSLADHLPVGTRRVYDVRNVIAALGGGGRHLELAVCWAHNMVTTLARLNGRPVGVIANAAVPSASSQTQPRHLGGIIDSAASEKGSWFVDLC